MGAVAGAGGMMLAGAELQAALLAKRNQLKPVPQAGGQGAPVSGAPANGGKGAGGGGLDAVLRKGLERFRFGDDADVTGGI